MLPKYMHKLVEGLDEKCIQDMCKKINMTYHTYMRDYEIWNFLIDLFPEQKKRQLLQLERAHAGHKIVNHLLEAFYPSEKVIKAKFIKQFLKKKNEISIFEFVVENSRVDVCRINGNSYAYEIKTQYDSLDKLNKQVDDYLAAFEYVYVVLHEKFLSRAQQIIPAEVGVIIFSCNQGQYEFKKIKEADYSNKLDSNVQLNCFSSEDLKFALSYLMGIKPLSLKEERKRQLLKCLESTENNMNSIFKQVMKNKFQENWERVNKIYYKVQPIDIQAFYQSAALKPSWVYYKSESIVCK